MSSEKQSNDKKQNSSLIYWNSGVNLSNSIGTYNFLKYGGMTSSLATENSTSIVVTSPITVSNLTVKLMNNNNDNNTKDVSPGSQKSRTFVVRKNGVPTSLTVTISESSTSGSNDNVQINFNKYDTISLAHYTTTGATNNAIGVVSVEQTNK